MFLLVFSCTLLCYGIYLIYITEFIRPKKACVSAVSKIKLFTADRRTEHIIGIISKYLIKFVKLSEEKQRETQRMLDVLGLKHSPEEYTAKILAKALLCLIAGLLLTPLISPAFVVFAPCGAWIVYYYEMKALKKQYKKRRADIELDLPKLCSVINSRLQSTSNVQSILASFLSIANISMAAELTVTLADMKTGNVETALRRFEGRISSPKVSDIVRGLIAVQNGDDLRVFFQSKQYQFNNDYLTIKKKHILARPFKLTPPGILLFLFFFLISFYPIFLGMKEVSSGIF